VGRTLDPVKLPTAVTSLFTDWKTSQSPAFLIFRKYAYDIAETCVHDGASDDKFEFFLHKSSPNTCRERIKDEAANRVLSFVSSTLTDGFTKKKLGKILQRSTSKSLLEMSRQDPENRQKNENFLINLKRKLCLELWPDDETVICTCGQQMDAWGDHAFCYKIITKTTMSNEIRDGIYRLLQRLLITVRMISTTTQVEKELEGLIKLAPRLRPFDLSVKLDHILGDSIWQTPLRRLGFDVTVIFLECF